MMGKIKSKAVRRAARTLKAEDLKFSDKFEDNKKILNGVTESKKIRNQISGLISKVRKREIIAENNSK